MVLSAEQKNKYMKRLLMSRLRLLMNNGFYGLLLMHMIYTLDEECETASTDGKRLYFGPGFLDGISDSELDFIMMHEILHVVLQHCTRQGTRNNTAFNIACDIVVNSNILKSNGMDPKSITLKKYGESMHLAPDGKEGYLYTAEQVYEMLMKKAKRVGAAGGTGKGGRSEETVDDHGRWGTEDDEALKDLWKKRLIDACEAISNNEGGRGILPVFAERLLKEWRHPQTDWRTILNEFVQEEIVDYSFAPPDRRFDESPFFLPEFNEMDDKVEDILFMVDTSGSMTDEMVAAAYSEINGAIEQFNGKLRGWLGFFDAAVKEPVPFESNNELNAIKPVGGGGTDFEVIFEYVNANMAGKLPASIIILTDGFASFPNESISMGIPVLWLLNNDKINPPWGKVARITLD